MKYDLFISYSRSDYIDAHENVIPGSAVERILEVLDANNITYWIDIHGDYSHDNNFVKKIVSKINASNAVLFLSSKASNNSEWVQKEISHANNTKKIIIPFLIDDYSIEETIKFQLGQTDMIYYYKNQKASLRKLVGIVDHTKDQITEAKKPNLNVNRVLFITGVTIAIMIVAFLFCFSLGFVVGYFGNRVNSEDFANHAYKNNQVTIVDNHTISFTGDCFIIKYDLKYNTTYPIMIKEHGLFQNATLKDIMLTVSFSTFMQRIVKNAKSAGNGKTKILYVVGGCVGFFCGYSVGNYVGTEYAILKNENDMKDYFNNPTIHDKLQQMIDDYYQTK
ncbi:MAG: toll/interleukin-1 receptor domain-containing protein [Bacteroidales bacterium]|nr:toll/interleukin-1 receptor domain-containing protein [Bacteroidales bacterium]